MSVAADIARSWVAPRRVIRRHIARGLTEERALGLLMIACLLLFIARAPVLLRAEAGADLAPVTRMAGGLMGAMILAPLLFYALAALGHLLARALGGRGSWLGARHALFWALLASTPLALLYGAAEAVMGAAAAQPLGLAVGAAFLGLWALCLAEAESGRAAAPL
jgi:hypothetical protein